VSNTIPPDSRAQGQSGHVGDHNNIADVLTAMQAQLGGLPTSWAWGTATLVAGTVTVSSGIVQSTSKIQLSRMTPGGTLGHLSVPTITPGTSFVITSSAGSETSVITYLILNP
jgi:hypothetical protein